MVHEKRKYIRFKVEDKIFVAFGTQFSKIGKLKDISMGGLAFQYIEHAKTITRNYSRLSIFHNEDTFYLPDIGCIVIADQPLYTNHKVLTLKSTYLVKKCAVKFHDITAHQRDKLEFLINNYTCGLIPFLNKLST
jgi:hypothetical protein